MSTDEPQDAPADATAASDTVGTDDTPTDTADPTYVGVCVGVEHLLVAAPATGSVGTALVIEGDHLHERHAILTAAATAMQARGFDDPTGEAQLFEAMWHQLRPQVYNAATRAVPARRAFRSCATRRTSRVASVTSVTHAAGSTTGGWCVATRTVPCAGSHGG